MARWFHRSFMMVHSHNEGRKCAFQMAAGLGVGRGAIYMSTTVNAKFEAECVVAVEVVPPEPFVPNETESLVELQRPQVGHLRFQDDFFAPAADHFPDATLDQLAPYRLFPVLLDHREHAYVTAETAALVGFHFAYDAPKILPAFV